jgi:hypothetical protein
MSSKCLSAVIAVLYFLHLTAFAVASPPEVSPTPLPQSGAPSVEDVQCPHAMEVRVGDTIQCSGIVWPPAWTIKAIHCKEIDLPRCENELNWLKETSAYNLEALNDRLEVADRALGEQSLLLDECLDFTQPDPWWESPYLWTSVGFVIGAGVAVSITYAVNAP